jgi:hypothetical protein
VWRVAVLNEPDTARNGRPPLQSWGPETLAIARGEVVVIDEEFGLRITDVVTAPGPVADPGA